MCVCERESVCAHARVYSKTLVAMSCFFAGLVLLDFSSARTRAHTHAHTHTHTNTHSLTHPFLHMCFILALALFLALGFALALVPSLSVCYRCGSDRARCHGWCKRFGHSWCVTDSYMKAHSDVT